MTEKESPVSTSERPWERASRSLPDPVGQHTDAPSWAPRALFEETYARLASPSTLKRNGDFDKVWRDFENHATSVATREVLGVLTDDEYRLWAKGTVQVMNATAAMLDYKDLISRARTMLQQFSYDVHDRLGLELDDKEPTLSILAHSGQIVREQPRVGGGGGAGPPSGSATGSNGVVG